jgi:hypothetical protein
VQVSRGGDRMVGGSTTGERRRFGGRFDEKGATPGDPGGAWMTDSINRTNDGRRMEIICATRRAPYAGVNRIRFQGTVSTPLLATEYPWRL